MPTSIVTYVRRPKRAARKAKAAAAPVAGIVTVEAKRSARQPKPEPEIEEDPEADARVKAFFTRMIRPGGALPPEKP